MRAILVPVKSFAQAKHRLSSVLDDRQRAHLAQAMASRMLEVNGTTDLFVACDDGTVADWAAGTGAFVLWTPGLGLSGAVDAGVTFLGREGYSLAVVAHADIPQITSLREFGTEDVVTLAPDRTLDGTNVAAVPTRSGFRFSYGPRSFSRHRNEALRLGLGLRVVYDTRLATDVDVPDDLVYARELLDRIEAERAMAEPAAQS
jgi:2-phospho-L-lactate guanylyltransferase